MEWFFIIALVIVGVMLYKSGAFGKLFGGNSAPSEKRATLESSPEKLPYKRRDYLFTKAERSFYDVLVLTLKDYDVCLFAKVRLLDLFYIPQNTKDRAKYFNKIQAKHVDFVICNNTAIRPLVAIELDDSSHSTERRAIRDEFVDNALAAAGLPLVRVSARRSYSVVLLKQQIGGFLPTKESLMTSQPTEISSDQSLSAIDPTPLR